MDSTQMNKSFLKEVILQFMKDPLKYLQNDQKKRIPNVVYTLLKLINKMKITFFIKDLPSFL